MSTLIHYEQAVYGSFPFWDQGYSVLARSPGCRPEWLADLQGVCQKYGEQPSGATEAGGLFALRLSSGPWVIVGPSAQGNDDRGRPGALAFHAIFVSPREYRRIGYDPFAVADLLRTEWTAETRILPSGIRAIEPAGSPVPPSSDEAARILLALTSGRRFVLETDGPIDELAREVWRGLPLRLRKRASVATWAFGNANAFDLVALPRLASVELDPSYVVETSLVASKTSARGGGFKLGSGDVVSVIENRGTEPPPTGNSPVGGGSVPRSPYSPVGGGSVPRSPYSPVGGGSVPRSHDSPVGGGSVPRSYDFSDETSQPIRTRSNWSPTNLREGLPGYLLPASIAAMVLGALLGLAWQFRLKSHAPPARTIVYDQAPPDRARYLEEPIGPVERQSVTEALADMADRFGIAQASAAAGREDPLHLLTLLSERLRYEGPLLSAAELERLDREPGHERDRALAWHARVRQFRHDRPLPADFASGPLRWQLDTLAWSFHVVGDSPGAQRSLAEIPHALANTLAVDVSLVPISLSNRYPALRAYAEFLGKLPRR